MNFNKNLSRMCGLVHCGGMENARSVFSNLSDGDFRLLWEAALLQTLYQYDRKGKLSGEPSDGLSGEFEITKFKPVSGESRTK